jgi:internalin A
MSKTFFLACMVSLHYQLGDPPKTDVILSNPEVDLRQFKNPETVVTLDVTGSNVVRSSWPALGKFKQLREAWLDSSSISDEDLVYLMRLRNLETLSLCDTNLTDSGLRQLKNLTRLKYLNLSYLQTSSQGLESLQFLTKLETLKLQGTGVQGGLKHIQGLRNLKQLSLVFCVEINNKDDVTALAKITSLRDLNLGHTKISSEHCNKLIQLVNLEVLDLGFTEAGDIGKLLSELKSLRELNFERVNLSANTLKSLGSLKNLEVLCLRGTNVGNTAMLSISKLKNIKVLDLTATDIDVFGVGHLRDLKGLTELRLNTKKIKEEDHPIIRKWFPRTKVQFK